MSKNFWLRILSFFKFSFFSAKKNSSLVNLNEFRNSKKPKIVCIVKEEKNLRTAISLCSRISLSYPKFSHFLFSKKFTDNYMFARLPNNLKVKKFENGSYPQIVRFLAELKPKVVILIDSIGCSELFAECKKLKVKVFWINASRISNYNRLIISSGISRIFSKFYNELYNNVSVYSCDNSTRQFLLRCNAGYNLKTTVAEFKDEPVTLPRNNNSQLIKKFSSKNRVIWFAAGVYEDEIDTIIECQKELSEWLPNIYLFLLFGKTADNGITPYDKISGHKLKNDNLIENNIVLVKWKNHEIVESLRSSQITLLGGSLRQKSYDTEIFDPIIPISYSSSIITGPNYGCHSNLISDLISHNGIKAIDQSLGSNKFSHEELLHAVFEGLKSNILADRISNAWLMTTQSSTISDEFISELGAFLDG
ncbi:MAG: hypothetical protein ACJZ8A_00015 [Paracoccaceae bacterium]